MVSMADIALHCKVVLMAPRHHSRDDFTDESTTASKKTGNVLDKDKVEEPLVSARDSFKLQGR
jgi:hypothetical protein